MGWNTSSRASVTYRIYIEKLILRRHVERINEEDEDAQFLVSKRNLESLIHDRIASALNTMCGSAALLNRVET